MELELSASFLALLLPIALFLSLAFFFFSTGSRKAKAHGADDGRRKSLLPMPPSPPGGYPLLGHLPLLGFLPHRTLRAMARTHGPVMLLRLGRVPVVVASSAAAAQEAMTKARDVAFAGRTQGPMIDRLLYGCDMAFAPYGEHWRQARRVCVLHLLSHRCVRSFRRVRAQETAALLDRVRDAAGAPVNLTNLLVSYSSVVLLRAAFGYDSRYRLAREGKILRKLLDDTGKLLGWGTLGELVPWLAWVDSIMGVHAMAARSFDALDGFLERGIAGHRTRRRGGRRDGDGGDADDDEDSRRSFVSVLLDAKEEDEAGQTVFDTVAIKAIIMDMFLAGTDTTASTLEWAMAVLMNHPDKMHRLQEEIRTVIHGSGGGGDNQVTEDQLGKLRHLKPVIKETLRLHMPSPLVFRETVEDTELLGYHVPARTRFIIDVGAIARDPATWERAEEFLPERWFGDDAGPVAAAAAAAAAGHFTFLPFGGGRRGCPGAGFSMASVELVLASLLYHFDWELPAADGSSMVDMDEVFGLAMRLKKPLRLVAKPWSPCS